METKTPEQILNTVIDSGVTILTREECLQAMETYAQQQTTKLQADKDKLALMLERIHLMFLNRDMRETSAVIKQTLSECGY